MLGSNNLDTFLNFFLGGLLESAAFLLPIANMINFNGCDEIGEVMEKNYASNWNVCIFWAYATNSVGDNKNKYVTKISATVRDTPYLRLARFRKLHYTPNIYIAELIC